VARIIYVDLLRIIASVQMLQGHTIDAVLGVQYRQGAIYSSWSFSRGLTSVAFLFVAGLAFELSTLRRLQSHRRNHRAVQKRFRRAGMLVVLGYLLHLPVAAAFASNPLDAANALSEFLIADILQCIGITLAFLELLVILTPSRRTIILTSLGTAFVLLGVSPFCADIQALGTCGFLLNYLTASGGSLFPLVPWAAHFLLGVVVGGMTDFGSENKRVFVRLFAFFLIFVLSAWFVSAFGGSLVISSHLLRLGLVVLVSAFLAWYSRRRDRLPLWLEFLAGETLIIYVFHILLVYGYSFGLGSIIGRTLSPFTAILAALLVIGVTVAFVFAYRRFWQKHTLASASATG